MSCRVGQSVEVVGAVVSGYGLRATCYVVRATGYELARRSLGILSKSPISARRFAPTLRPTPYYYARLRPTPCALYSLTLPRQTTRPTPTHDNARLSTPPFFNPPKPPRGGGLRLRGHTWPGSSPAPESVALLFRAACRNRSRREPARSSLPAASRTHVGCKVCLTR